MLKLKSTTLINNLARQRSLISTLFGYCLDTNNEPTTNSYQIHAAVETAVTLCEFTNDN